MIYYNGQEEIEVSEIDKLKDLTQEETNNLASGPQDLFFSKLDGVNHTLQNYGIKTLAVNDKWNWKPGAYPIMREFISKKLEIDKKCQSLTKLLDRTRSNVNYTNYLTRQIKEMEIEKNNLKRLGVLKDVDIDKFKEKCVEFVKRIEEQCSKASELTKGDVTINTFVTDLETRVPRIYYNIILNNLTLSIYDGDKMIQEIPLAQIHIIISQNLRTKLGIKNKDIRLTGVYQDSNYKEAKFPYIASGYNNTEYSTVCLDKHYDDVSNAIYKNDLISLSFILMQWAQYYHISHSNPYNQPHMLKFGMPGEYSDEYSATQSSSAVNNRSNEILERSIKSLNLNYIDASEYYVSSLDLVECKYRNLNNDYLMSKMHIQLQNTEYYYKTESLVILLLNNIMRNAENPNSIWTISEEVSNLTGQNIGINKNSYQEGDNQITDIKDTQKSVTYALFNYFMNRPYRNGFRFIDKTNEHMINELNPYDCNYVFSYLEAHNFIEDEKAEYVNDIVTSDDKMKEMMKNWANSSERSA